MAATAESTEDGSLAVPRSSGTKGRRRPNLHQIHADRVPVKTYPLPLLNLHNPLATLYCLGIVLSQTLFPNRTVESVSSPIYKAHFWPASRTVHVADEATMRALWERGFFGKGSLSRSEPAWMAKQIRLWHDGEAARNGRVGMTSEEVTAKRRDERHRFKLERAKAAKAAVEEQLRRERGEEEEGGSENQNPGQDDGEVKPNRDGNADVSPTGPTEQIASDDTPTEPALQERLEPVIKNREHTDITLEEAFFLVYGLGVLSIHCPAGVAVDLGITPEDNHDNDNKDDGDANRSGAWLHAPTHTFALLTLFRAASYPIAPRNLGASLRNDDPFLTRYVAYHHFRSLGWVVREGVKFGVDYLLYYKGPAFSHAEFAVVVVPQYDENDKGGGGEDGDETTRRKKNKITTDWWWLHCVNRVQAHVFKTLVLAYVDVPTQAVVDECGTDVGRLLKSYCVRDFCIRRWVPNRNRD